MFNLHVMEPCVGRFKSTAINEFMRVEPKNIAADRNGAWRDANSLITDAAFLISLKQSFHVTDA